MKKVLFSIIALLLIPCVVNAASIETSFDDERCVLTVSGTQTGHEATVSLFKNNNLVGFKTGEISNSNYEVEFVLGYDEDTTIDITLSNENGTNELSKNNVSIPACDPPVVEHHDDNPDDNPMFYLNKILDPMNNALEDLNDKKPFHIDDKLAISVVSSDDFSTLPQEDQDNIAALNEMLGERKTVLALMFVSILDDVDVEKHIPDSNYRLLLKSDKSDYEEVHHMMAMRLLDEDTMDFTEGFEVLYDDRDAGIYFNTSNVGIFVIYNDDTVYYDFLDDTDEQTFYKKSDKSLTLKINAPRDKFVDVYVDGKKVDEKYYTVKSGSTIITFTEEFLKGLDAGEHKFLVNFTDGEASAVIGVENTSNPNTGDKVIMYVGTALIAISGLGAVLLLNKKLKHN